MLAIILTALLCIVIPPAIIFIAAWLGERKSETFDLSPYREPQRDPRPDNVVDLVARLKASRAGNAGATADISSSAFYPDASSPRSGGGARAGRIGRDGIGEADSSHRGKWPTA